tara:strand:+ start:110 stop:385 length:276 start_codon:yes stop_codon:yes gene_type:complete
MPASSTARLQTGLQTNAPVKGGIAMVCPSLDKTSTACCYFACQNAFDECTENEADSDRQEDSDCANRKKVCFEECAVEPTAPRTWGTHNTA